MIINQKIEIQVNKEDSFILESQSRMCNKMYNMLLEEALGDGSSFNMELISGRNLRDRIVELKKKHGYFYSVHSSPIKNVAFRLKDAFERYFHSEDHSVGKPKFRSCKKGFFSLLYDEPNKGVKVDGKDIKISLGKKIEDGKEKRLYVNGKLKEKIKKGEVRTYRITKCHNRFYLIVTLKVEEKEKKGINKVIAIDPNHTNFFVGIDNEGNSIEVGKLSMIKYFDLQIDKVKSKLDKCIKQSKKCESKGGVEYWIPSNRYERLEKTLSKLYVKRHEQLNTALFSIANYLCEKYDKILIGDYVPSLETAKYKNMHRAMLNQSPIGAFRRILSYVCAKTGKHYEMVNERDTTKTCCFCGNIEKHDPSVRKFECPCCHKILYRDINSAINIGKKVNLLSSSDYVSFDLSKPKYTEFYSYKNSCKTWN